MKILEEWKKEAEQVSVMLQGRSVFLPRVLRLIAALEKCRVYRNELLAFSSDGLSGKDLHDAVIESDAELENILRGGGVKIKQSKNYFPSFTD